MPEADDSQIRDFSEALRQVTEVVAPLGTQLVQKCLERLQEVMSPYPPQPDRDRANPGDRPSPYNTYVRGIGHLPRSAFKQGENGITINRRGMRNARRQGKIRYTSQQMDKRWSMRVSSTDSGADGTLVNKASYSGSVMGHTTGGGDGIPQQASFHTATGWTSIDEGLEQMNQTLEVESNRITDEILNLLGSG